MNVAVIDDHVLLGHVLVAGLIEAGFGATSIPVGANIVNDVAAAEVDVVLLDLELGQDSVPGVDLIEPLLGLGLQVIILSGVDDRLLLGRCLEHGVAGIIGKDIAFNVLVQQISNGLTSQTIGPPMAQRLELLQELAAHRRSCREAIEPFRTLSGREMAVLHCLMNGQSPAEISEQSFVAVSTIRTQIKAVLRKLGVSSQLQAVALAHQVGWPHVLEERVAS